MRTKSIKRGAHAATLLAICWTPFAALGVFDWIDAHRHFGGPDAWIPITLWGIHATLIAVAVYAWIYERPAETLWVGPDDCTPEDLGGATVSLVFLLGLLFESREARARRAAEAEREACDNRLKWNTAGPDCIAAKVNEIVAEAALDKNRPFGSDTDFSEICGSVENVEVLMHCEEEFGIEIDDEDACNLATVRQVIEYVQERVDRRQGPQR